MSNDNNIVQRIGVPAVLETCAEECNELAKVCLKLSRKLRNEQPTPKTMKEILNELTEEIADVITCIEVIADETDLISDDLVFTIADTKRKRWNRRIDEFLSAKEEGIET